VKARLLVFGDAIADLYAESTVHRISPEAPVPVVLRNGAERLCPGGALNVATNAAALGAEVAVVAVVGEDREGEELRMDLQGLGIDSSGLIAGPGAHTITKTRLISRGHHIVRVDREAGPRHYLSHQAAVTVALEHAVAADPGRLVLLSDYGKGTVAGEHLAFLAAEAASDRLRVIVDPWSSADVRRYRGLWGLKANWTEAEALLGRPLPNSEALEIGVRDLRDEGFEVVWITLGARGSLSLHDQEIHWQESRSRSVFDVTGAGDTYLAALGVALAEGQSVREATAFANIASGIAVERAGTTVVRRREIALESHGNRSEEPWESRLLSAEEAAAAAERCRADDLRVGFTNGCFDLLHPGHVDSLEWAARHVDVLFVGLNSDASVQRLKGAGRPILSGRDRGRLLLGLRAVDYVVPFSEETPEELIRQIRPNVLFKGEDWAHFVAGGDFVKSYGGQVQLIPLTPGLSTTGLVERIRGTPGGE
jgi:D-beta-D-heptose 7-phosphate kinase/D-beta-D-heptose 1-phosphate adenosyltransferase